jgi:hypothetical protein
MTMIAQSKPATGYWPPLLVVVVVVELLPDDDPPVLLPLVPAPGAVIVVLWTDVVDDHGCHAKSAMRTATTTMIAIPIAAPLPEFSP